MTIAGVTAVIQNSPKLYKFIVNIKQIVDENNIKIDLEGFKDTLKINYFTYLAQYLQK